MARLEPAPLCSPIVVESAAETGPKVQTSGQISGSDLEPPIRELVAGPKPEGSLGDLSGWLISSRVGGAPAAICIGRRCNFCGRLEGGSSSRSGDFRPPVAPSSLRRVAQYEIIVRAEALLISRLQSSASSEPRELLPPPPPDSSSKVILLPEAAFGHRRRGHAL